MQQLHFTIQVLGLPAAHKLTKHQVTQTLRSKESSITKAIQSGSVKVGDQLQVTLDDTVVGYAEFIIMDEITWIYLSPKDATRSGFYNLDGLERALQRAGYRFKTINMALERAGYRSKPINIYQFYRIQFSWV